jgi:CheY-like chemotaxis protein
MRVVLTENEPHIASVIARALLRDGHVVAIAGSIGEARQSLGRGADLLILDLSLPDGSGARRGRERLAAKAVRDCRIARSRPSARAPGAHRWLPVYTHADCASTSLADGAEGRPAASGDLARRLGGASTQEIWLESHPDGAPRRVRLRGTLG